MRNYKPAIDRDTHISISLKAGQRERIIKRVLEADTNISSYIRKLLERDMKENGY